MRGQKQEEGRDCSGLLCCTPVTRGGCRPIAALIVTSAASIVVGDGEITATAC